jgi:hypothetical protein
VSTTTAWRKYASGDDRRMRPKCYLCRQPQNLLIVGGHTLPPRQKWGQKGGVKRLGLCRFCIFTLAREASLLESQVRERDALTTKSEG